SVQEGALPAPVPHRPARGEMWGSAGGPVRDQTCALPWRVLLSLNCRGRAAAAPYAGRRALTPP
ncbi:MAG: hypothetical protein M3442_02680, partial [Chloroflexota bacterium]|nr:hypothetical protein [Chloroflexota bacterium]